ncbi:hypothetical protein YC2023_022421 [Brassica napus]
MQTTQERLARDLQHGASKSGQTWIFIGRLRKMSGGEVVVTAARVYRDLLKAVVKHVGKEDHKSHFTDFVKTEFRKKKAHSLEKINLARNYTYLLNSIHSHKDLLFSYNIAVDRTEEMKRVLGKSAASVGLRLPEVYPP